MSRYNVLVEVNQSDVRIAIHAPVEAVVERGKQPLRTYLLLRHHVELPRQQGDNAAPHVVPQDAADGRAQRVVVEREVFHAQEGVQFQELQHLKGLDANEGDVLSFNGMLAWERVKPHSHPTYNVYLREARFQISYVVWRSL